MEKIKYSVGRGGVNTPRDIVIVQRLLNRHQTSSGALLAVNRIMDGHTVQAIKEFQQRVVKMPHPDGRVDPGKMTAELLYTSPYLVVIQSIVDYVKSLVANTETQKKKSSAGEAVVLQANILSQHNQIAWGAKVSPEFKAKVIKVCDNLGINPDFLMTCMAFETKETFSPSIKNDAGSSGTGLIQFMKRTAKVFHTSTKDLAAMSDVQQLDYVEKYFKDAIRTYKKLDTLEDVYFAILNPTGIRKKDDFVLFKEGTDEYDKNKGLDKDGDGQITVTEVTNSIKFMYKKGLKQGYIG